MIITGAFLKHLILFATIIHVRFTPAQRFLQVAKVADDVECLPHHVDVAERDLLHAKDAPVLHPTKMALNMDPQVTLLLVPLTFISRVSLDTLESADRGNNPPASGMHIGCELIEALVGRDAITVLNDLGEY